MKFKIGDIVRVGMKVEGRLDDCDEYWQIEKTEGVVIAVDRPNTNYPVSVRFNDMIDGENSNVFEERSLKLVRRAN